MSARSWLLVVCLTACGGGGAAEPDSGITNGPPGGWTCDPRDYNDGVVCHCNCGVPDPDCTNHGLVVSGCVNDQVCSDTGTCTACGNGIVDPGEACDVALPATAECGTLGYQPGPAACNASCKWAYDQCTPLATCGNGMLDPAELCDGTAIKPGLDCTDYNRTSGTLSCASSCTINSSGCYTCGDGKVEGPEGCDDHGIGNGDGCSSTCTVESGWHCTGEPSSCAPTCGDGMRVGSEACDDGNTNDNDGCSSSCQVEQDCTCTGSPSTCTCATVQTILTTTQSIDTGSLALDGTNQPHATYYYGVDYTDPVTNYQMEHGHAMFAERSGAVWTTSELEAYDQLRTIIGPEAFSLAYDGGVLRAFYQRIYNTAGTFAVATRNASWQYAYDNPYYIYNAIRGGSDWHALVAGSGFGDLRYYMGAPGAWTRNEPLTGFNTSYPTRLGVATNGDVYIAQVSPGTNHTSYNVKLSKRVNATTWSTVYDIATSGTCVYPVSHQPLALANGEMIAFEDGLMGGTQRTLKAHRLVGSTWVTETVSDLSWLNNTCSAGSTSWSAIHTASAVDQLGQPHILYASPPYLTSTTLEDHYRDAAGWHVRTFPLTKGAPLDMKIDAAGTTHILALAPAGTGMTRLVYIRISATAW